ncbi:uncharacterized protein LOC126672286 [Mercurialis annua]|uniref:uncharacterized protein LOC126672286 n=1 Tax=Mercurialis annua TaxID=3986 RepID=UPI00215E0DA5|nr:uncharacterized protein LOC126672286 [Mercurialis annua]
MAMDPSELTSIPIWIHLPGLPWEFWTKEMLSKIGSTCGAPLYCDQCTLSKTKLDFARILVEMEANGEFPNRVILQDERGAQFSQKIDYEWKPQRCEVCKKLGHLSSNCKAFLKSQVCEEVSTEQKVEDSIVEKIKEDNTVPMSSKKSKTKTKVSPNPFDVLGKVDIIGDRITGSQKNGLGVIGEGRKGRILPKPFEIDK